MITIVSGLPRSGTSMMMKMIEAGGIEPLVDNIRKADEDNPKGYYEFERVKKIDTDASWLDEAEGRVVKMVSMLLKKLPADRRYKVVFMKRILDETLASQKVMLQRLGQPTDDVGDAEMRALFEKHLAEIQEWLARQENIDVLYVQYNEIMSDPVAGAAAVNRFLGGGLDENAMASVVDPTLYRNRAV